MFRSFGRLPPWLSRLLFVVERKMDTQEQGPFEKDSKVKTWGRFSVFGCRLTADAPVSSLVVT